ncbi:putative male sterility protein [Phlyctema vagabunda]|uniref:Male sterility protein n=1 Tax=Phlyctema vagabunda TaxID=108571 RepID=A0ABR4PF07_9HELO
MEARSNSTKGGASESRILPPTSYFTCTLGEAAILDGAKVRSHATINDFLDYQAETIPLQPAVVFPVPGDDGQEWSHELLIRNVALKKLCNYASRAKSSHYCTTSGMPKPIAQSHFAAVGALPNFSGHDAATFTTTPLYHGGIADCFRAWTSDALIWLYPESKVAISAKNIIKSLTLARSLEHELPRIRYFSSVPYVLQILAEDDLGLSWLRDMENAGVGGAALPKSMGDSLVAEGVSLVSRYGSAECGFLLSSHRNYDNDKDWRYLSPPTGSLYLRFDLQDDESGLSELIVLPGWPHMAKMNRADGSWATGDLFEPHSQTKNAWKYHSRNDGLITLITGKKFDPSPLEEEACSSSPVISEVLIFGSGRQYPGALIFPKAGSEERLSDDIVNIVWKEMERVNRRAPAHAKLAKNMLIIMEPTPNALARSSKGTILRKQAEEKYNSFIGRAYEQDDTPSEAINVSDSKVLSWVEEIIQQVVGTQRTLDPSADFFYQGIDSAKCVQIRAQLQKIVPKDQKLPWNVVYDQGNLQRLSEFLIQVRHGSMSDTTKDESELMLNLVKQYSKFGKPEGLRMQNDQKSKQNVKDTILLTGATGTLGVNILSNLRENSTIAKIMCLVRAENNLEARIRVSRALLKAKKEGLVDHDQRVLCLASTISDSNLGLSESEFSVVQQESTVIIHTAWAVNFSLPLQSFVHAHIAGLHNLINITYHQDNPAKFIFCSSTASVLGPNHHPKILERISDDPTDSDALGYSRSKWVAEAICARVSMTRKLRGRISVLRIGQLTGDTRTGVWNMKEAWPLMLSTSTPDVLDCLPALEERIAWLPVDIAAQTVISIALSNLDQNEDDSIVTHVASTSHHITWIDIISWIQRTRGPDEKPLQIISPRLWLDRLEVLATDHPAKQLLGLWRKAYSDQDQETESEQDRKRVLASGPDFVPVRTNRVLGGEEWSCTGVDEQLIKKIWAWIQGGKGAVK